MYKSIVKGKGGIEAKVVADSIANGVRLTTMELRFHRFILPEFNTHRMFSRNFSSSRAIPVAKMIEQVENEPAMPVHWGKNQAGMHAKEENFNRVVNPEAGRMYDDNYRVKRHEAWGIAARKSSEMAEHFSDAGYHKQIVNRLLEPFQFVKGVVTATEWDNFFALRNHSAAQPEIQELARCMKQAIEESEPEEKSYTSTHYRGWHLPYVSQEEAMMLDEDVAIKCSVARCARVSYMKHDNSSPSVADDLELYNQLAVRPYTDKRGCYYPENDPVHLSPLEHQATPMPHKDWMDILPIDGWMDYKGITHMDREYQTWSGNFRSWIQYRQLIQND